MDKCINEVVSLHKGLSIRISSTQLVCCCQYLNCRLLCGLRCILEDMQPSYEKIRGFTSPVIITQYTPCGVNVEKIIKRIVKYIPKGYLEGLREIAILDLDPRKKGFASYWSRTGRIELYVKDIIGWQPWVIKKSFVIPYLSLGLALGHEIDHHVTRNQTTHNKEKQAESNAYRYIYPSFGIFKPLAKLISLFFRRSPWKTC